MYIHYLQFSLSLFSLFVLAIALPHNLQINTTSHGNKANSNASPLTIQLAPKYSLSPGGNFLEFDKLRLQQMRSANRYATGSSFKQNSSSGSQLGTKFLVNSNVSDIDTSIPTTPLTPVFSMTANIQVGTPPTTYDLLVDTGSSNFVVGADLNAGPLFVPSDSTHSLGETVAVSYGSGFFIGNEFTDSVTVGGIPPVIQSFAVPNVSEGFDQFDGIIGLGLSVLTVGTLIDEPDEPIPTITDTLAASGSIASDLAALTVPLVSNPTTGAIDFGAPDFSKNTSIISYTSLVTTGETAGFWSVLESVTYGSGTDSVPLVSNAPGIMDVGTSLLLLPTAAFQQYAQLINATLDPTSGLLTIPNNNVNNLQSLFFTIGDATLEFTANAQLFPQSLMAEAGLDSSLTYLILSDGDTASGGIDFINGFVWLERYYSVFDTTNNQIGLAYNVQTFEKVN